MSMLRTQRLPGLIQHCSCQLGIHMWWHKLRRHFFKIRCAVTSLETSGNYGEPVGVSGVLCCWVVFLPFFAFAFTKPRASNTSTSTRKAGLKSSACPDPFSRSQVCHLASKDCWCLQCRNWSGERMEASQPTSAAWWERAHILKGHSQIHCLLSCVALARDFTSLSPKALAALFTIVPPGHTTYLTQNYWKHVWCTNECTTQTVWWGQ